MSGRLVILRHKSWNVWNRDNQEKVLRDERLSREENDLKKKDNKRKISDTVYSKLQSNNEEIDFVQGETSSRTKEVRKGSERDKSNDWKLGDGSKEVTKVLPWYEQRHRKLDSSIPEQGQNKKRHLDPMAIFSNDVGRNESKEDTTQTVVSDVGHLMPINSNSNSHIYQNNSSVRESERKMSSDSKTAFDVHALREKRLQRERAERQRELRLLAELDIYGK